MGGADPSWDPGSPRREADPCFSLQGSCGASEPEERVDNCDASETPSGRRPRRFLLGVGAFLRWQPWARCIPFIRSIRALRTLCSATVLISQHKLPNISAVAFSPSNSATDLFVEPKEGPVRRQSHILPWAHCCRLPPSDAQRVYFAVQIEAKVNDEADAGRGTLPAPNCLDFIAAGDFWIKPFLGQIMGCFNTQIQPPKDNGSQLDGRSGGSGGFPGCRKTQHTKKHNLSPENTCLLSL